MTELAQAISVVMAVVLTPPTGYVLCQAPKVVAEMIPAVRDWRDFRGVDLGQPRTRATATRVRRIATTRPGIARTPNPAMPTRRPLALPRGATTNPAAEVAP